MEETKKELTVKEMDDVLQGYCEGQDWCTACAVKLQCDKCAGNFEHHPGSCKEAYAIVMKLQELTKPTLEADEVEITELPDAPEDVVNHPSHYTHGGMECIDEMILTFGHEAVMNFCLCNVWKYRKRALHKNGIEDMKKSDWYMNKYRELTEMEIINGTG